MYLSWDRRERETLTEPLLMLQVSRNNLQERSSDRKRERINKIVLVKRERERKKKN